MAMDESSPSSLRYKNCYTVSPRLEPLPDYDDAMPDQRWPSQPPSTPDFSSWLDRPNDENYYSRLQPPAVHRRSPLPEFSFPARTDPDFERYPDFEHPPDSERYTGFERDGWSPEPPCSPTQQNPPARRDSAARLPAVLDMSFLELFPPGHVTISYSNDVGDVERMHGINQDPIENCSFLLSQAIDGNGLHLEACTSLTIRPFLQFVYSGSYHLPTATGEALEDVPTSLLIHCQMFRLGDIYDIPDLKSFANVHIIRQCEFGCSSPERPVDLCAAIDYVYRNMREHSGVIETIIAYCVTCFLSHGLGDNFEFRRLAFDLRPFHQDLCRVGMERRFENDHVAQAIIQMPFKPYAPATYASREDSRAKQIFDDVYHFHGDDEDLAHKARRRAEHQLPASDFASLASAGPSKRNNGHGSATEDDDIGQTTGLLRKKDDQALDGYSPSGKRKSNGLTLRQRRHLPHEVDSVEPKRGESGLEGYDARFWHPYERLDMGSVLIRSKGKAAGDVDKAQPPSVATASNERGVEGSHRLCQSVVPANLPGRSDSITRPSAINQIGGISAALASAEAEKSNSDAEYEVISIPSQGRDHEPDSDSDCGFVKIAAQSSDVDMELGSDRASGREVGSASDSQWDMI